MAKSTQKSNFDRKYWASYVSSILQKQAMKAAFSFLAKKVVWLATGPWGWLFGLVFGVLWNRFGDKFVFYLSRKGALLINKADGNIKAGKIGKARENGNASDYDNAVDDVLG